MCFEQETQKTQTKQANPFVEQAATSNLQFVQGLRDQGFTPYSGQQVASIAPGQQGTIDAALGIANDGTGARSTQLIDQYAGAPAQSVSANTISSAMSPYMNQYVMQALAPQLRQMDISNAAQNAAVNAQATGSGAFGDARAGIEAANTRFNQAIQRQGLIGQAYNNAFNTAIGAGAQDVANNLAAQNANAGYAESALARALGGSTALQNLQTQQMGVQGAANQLAGQETAQNQADLTARYNQWLMAQQYPFQTAQLVNQTTTAGATAMPASTTETETKPDNSGWGLAGTLLSAFI